MGVQEPLGGGDQPAVDSAGQVAGGVTRPVRRQQRRRQAGIAQHDSAEFMDQENARGEGAGAVNGICPLERALERREAIDEGVVGGRKGSELPGGGGKCMDVVGGVGVHQEDAVDLLEGPRRIGEGDVGGRRQRGKTGSLQRRAGRRPVADPRTEQGQPQAPVERRRVGEVDALRRGVERALLAPGQSVIAVASRLLAREPAVSRQPRAGGTDSVLTSSLWTSTCGSVSITPATAFATSTGCSFHD